MKIVLIMPPSKDFENAFSYLQLTAKELFPLHEVQGWILNWDNENEKALPWLGRAEALFCRQREETLLFPQQVLPWLGEMCRLEKPDLIFVYGNIFGSQLTALLAETLGWGCFSDVMKLEFEDKIFAYKNVCSSNAIWKKEIGEKPYVLAITEGKTAPTEEMQQAVPLTMKLVPEENAIDFKSKLLEKSEENPLMRAKTVFICGRGIGSKEGADRLLRLAKVMGAELGFSRPAAMNGWGSMDRVVGQSGIRISPKLCLAFGVSGSATFLSGVEGAGELIAVNTDPDAPIFKAADKGIIADANEIVSYLLKLALERKAEVQHKDKQ